MKAYITKYALTKGITVVEATAHENTNAITFKTGYSMGYTQYIYKPDWHTTFSEARDRAEEMRQRKIASLRKSLAKMETLTFRNPIEE